MRVSPAKVDQVMTVLAATANPQFPEEVLVDKPTDALEEIRDELVFALESSGVERFEPELHSDYRGREKEAEAVRDRQSTDQAQLKGKIAKVIKCGYRYVVDDDSFKVVRSARVKLFR